jgi:uncharacterized 2Fe-2S/4Fe-4S cluster protein (DUF4445 family)
MRAEVGAVEHVKIGKDGHVSCQVVGDAPPVGICGTGILDAIAEMHQAGIINRRGHLQAEAPGVFPQSDGNRCFKLAEAEQGGQGVIITQNDISQALLAKGAIRAGIDLLMEQQGVAAGEIDEVLIAGAFGTCLDSGNAVRIGMLPQVSTDRIKVVGNAAGAGVCLMLASQEARRHAEKLARSVTYLELTVHPKFTLFFVEGMRLPSPPVS